MGEVGNDTGQVIMQTSFPHSPTGLERVMGQYSSVHGPLSLTVCIIGIAMNVIIVFVLSRREMVSPVNRLLQAIGKASSVLFSVVHQNWNWTPQALLVKQLTLKNMDEKAFLLGWFICLHINRVSYFARRVALDRDFMSLVMVFCCMQDPQRYKTFMVGPYYL